jgi:hypothetical protein
MLPPQNSSPMSPPPRGLEPRRDSDGKLPRSTIQRTAYRHCVRHSPLDLCPSDAFSGFH